MGMLSSLNKGDFEMNWKSLKSKITNLCALATLCSGLLVISAVPAAAQSNGTPYMIYAQKLLQDTLAKHPDVVIMAFHVTPPKANTNVIVASNIGRIGKVADDDDMRVIKTEKNNLEVNETGVHFEDECVLRDKEGHNIGAVGIVFNYKNGDDKQKYAATAEKIRDEMSQSIPSRDKLFELVQ
jgi:hypothetical protein